MILVTYNCPSCGYNRTSKEHKKRNCSAKNRQLGKQPEPVKKVKPVYPFWKE
jgi:hypothetical protein